MTVETLIWLFIQSVYRSYVSPDFQRIASYQFKPSLMKGKN
jgi:hypothetical protein